MAYTIAALYKFVAVEDPSALQSWLLEIGVGLKGTLLVAEEGLNGTVAGSDVDISAFLSALQTDPRFTDIDVKFSHAEEPPFLRFKVRLKREIVTIGKADVDPTEKVGTYIAPEDWNAVIADPNTVVIDTRNTYEVAVGTFEGAIDPKTESFRDFPEWFENNREALEGKRIAMFCTGGIRCEKASSHLLDEGVDEVLHLKGGILKYLETVPEGQSRWQGDCFVFDQRVAVGHGLKETDWNLCFACRMPIRDEALSDPLYIPGVQCPHCADSDRNRHRYEERQRQIEIAKARGDQHIGQASETAATGAAEMPRSEG